MQNPKRLGFCREGSIVATGEFPKRLLALRKAKRPARSVTVTSQLMGLSPDRLRLYERGEAEPKMNSLIKIANYYHVSIDYLVGRTNC
ncbi:MAG: helix-turn-helix transcriptional regulator [Oscillospiraceae bacterium]|nr:helix-turn-helix transcriptional regulator [Oscillospiraceae bacterium]